jgi:hypothetical protein
MLPSWREASGINEPIFYETRPLDVTGVWKRAELIGRFAMLSVPHFWKLRARAEEIGGYLRLSVENRPA